MDTVPLYRESYIAHCAPPARICRLAPVPPVNVPISESTEQRDNFVGDAVEVCPAAQLLQRVPGCVMPADMEGPPGRWRRGVGRFRYNDRDDSGHEWYTFEESNLKGPQDIVYDPNRYVRGDSVEAVRSRVAANRAINWKLPQPTSQPIVT